MSSSIENIKTFVYKNKTPIMVIGGISLLAFLLFKRHYVIRTIYNQNNKLYLKDLDGGFRNKIKNLIAFADRQGYDVKLTSGHRNYSESMALGSVRSLHPFGRAVDMNLKKKESDEYITMTSPISEWEKTGIIEYAEKTLNLQWGGRFSTYKNSYGGYGDPVHFDSGEKYDDLIVKAKKKYGTIKEIYDNGFNV